MTRQKWRKVNPKVNPSTGITPPKTHLGRCNRWFPERHSWNYVFQQTILKPYWCIWLLTWLCDLSKKPSNSVLQQNCNQAQRNYSPGERKMLSIIKTLWEYSNILLGDQTKAYIDYCNNTKTETVFHSPRFHRWQWTIEDLNPTIKYYCLSLMKAELKTK